MIYDFVNENNFININKEKRHLLKVNFLIKNTVII